MKYAVEMTDAAFDAIRTQAKYIAIEGQSPLNAARWLEQVWDAVDGLERMPQIHNLADENAYKKYEVRRVIVGSHVLLFTIDEPAKTVWVIGCRHGARLPRPDDLPDAPPRAAS